MTKYAHEKQGDIYSILRNGDLVASYDPSSEEVNYFLNGSRYSGPIGKEIASIASKPAKKPDAPVKPPQEPPAIKVEKSTPQRVRDAKHIASLQREIHDLKAHISGERKMASSSARHFDDIDLSEAPARSKLHGDCTPEFVEWARNGGGGFTKEIFNRQFEGRIPDLTFKAT